MLPCWAVKSAECECEQGRLFKHVIAGGAGPIELQPLQAVLSVDIVRVFLYRKLCWLVMTVVHATREQSFFHQWRAHLSLLSDILFAKTTNYLSRLSDDHTFIDCLQTLHHSSEAP